MSNLIPAIMRTGVPIIYAILIKLGLGQLGLPDAVVTDVATVLLSVLLYAALRGLEAIEPRLGVLLGWVGQPQYGEVVQGTLLSVVDEVATATKDDLQQLREDVMAAIEHKITTPVAEPAPKPAAAKKPAKKPTTTKKSMTGTTKK